MRTLVAGIDSFRRAPIALFPLTIEAITAGMLILIGAFPARGASAAAGAAFPLDVYFDVKQALASTSSWPVFVGVMVGSVIVRSLALTLTLWLAEERPGSLLALWARGIRLVAVAVVVLAPSATLYFMGTALRYAPFIWVAALLGFVPALILARRGVAMDVGAGPLERRGVPETFGYLGYAYLIALVGAAMSSLSTFGRLLPALLVMCFGPLNALVLLGWRAHLREQTYPGGGTIAVVATFLVLATLGAATVYDRYVRDPAPVGRARAEGTLYLLGGVDSTLDEGSLATLDPRQIGYRPRSVQRVSYLGPGRDHRPGDTHRDLNATARVVSEQLSRGRAPRSLLGHSQAALVLDRILHSRLPGPDRSAMLAPSPPLPPPLEVPAPGETGIGKPGGDLTRLVGRVLAVVGGRVDVDAPAAPVQLEPVAVIDTTVPRLAVWALGDSAWLDGDWRRPGEVNVVAVTDHVGIANNSRALDSVERFFMGAAIADDSSSWRGVIATLIRHAFGPWRPAIVLDR